MRYVIILFAIAVLVPFSARAQSVGPAITEGLETCENGLRRCGSLSDNAPAYWLCMENTCSDSVIANANPVCDQGKRECQDRLYEYRSCMNLICRNRSKEYRECDAGKRQCSKSIERYWDCIHQTCLGSVREFLDQVEAAQAQREKIEKTQEDEERGYSVRMIRGKEFRYDLDGELIAPMLGVANSLRYPKEGIDPRAYLLETLPFRQMHGTPSANLGCRDPRAKLNCASNDMSSCSCSDGSEPYFVNNEIPVPKVESDARPMPNIRIDVYNEQQATEQIKSMESLIEEGMREIERINREAAQE